MAEWLERWQAVNLDPGSNLRKGTFLEIYLGPNLSFRVVPEGVFVCLLLLTGSTVGQQVPGYQPS